MNVAPGGIEMFDRDDLPTRPYPALAAVRATSPMSIRLLDDGAQTLDEDRAKTLEDAPRDFGSALSATLPISAMRAYRLMSQCERIPEWMAVVRSARILTRYLDGRPECVAFIANLKRASMGYTLRYTYQDDQLALAWSTAQGARTVVAGNARFEALGPRACMLHYEIELNKHSSLPAWSDDMYNGHPASSILSDFREFVQRTKEADSRSAP
jgi:uncharacterized membrane protein